MGLERLSILGIAILTMLALDRQASAAELNQTFDRPPLNPFHRPVWNHESQGDYPRLIQFGHEETDSGDVRFLRVSMDHARCTWNCPGGPLMSALPLSKDLLEDDLLGPSFIASAPVSLTDGGCQEGETRNGSEVTQRNELRLKNKERHWHAHGEPHWYDIRFKMTGDIVRCGSARQIIGQWKYDDPQWETDLGRIHQSPYLAQRFDNGVFHLTVQSHTCRCMIAKASGDPDARTALALRAPEERKLHPVEPLQCKLVDNTSPNEGQQCRPDNFQLFSLDPDGPAELPSAEEWLRMTYYNKADGAGGGVIDVYANNQFIVRAVGVIGYRGGSPDRTKFKFGIYRARVTCMTNMLVDHICFSKSSATCNADLELVPLPARRLMD